MENQQVPEGKKEYQSPPWSSNTKLVVALSFVAILAGIFVKFRGFIGPLLLAFIIAYLVHPLAEKIHRRIKISWRLAVFFLYIIGILTLIGLIVWGGIALIEQIQSLIGFLQNLIVNLPGYIDQLSHQVITIGPFEFDAQTIDLGQLTNQLIDMIKPIISNVGTFVGGIASGAVSGIGWVVFILMVSFFIVAGMGDRAGRFFDIQIPGYTEDIKRLGIELSRIWNAYFRNQVILISLTIVIYTIMLGSLQVRYFFGLALLAGLARFVPYAGPAVAWTTYGLVCLFQGNTIFGLSSFWYAVMVIALAMVVDSMIDNLVSTTLMADALKVHPAAVMVAVLMAASLLGVVGILLAAPVLASAKLMVDYAFDKMFDLDPWRNKKTSTRKRINSAKSASWRIQSLSLWNKLKGRIQSVKKNK